jgi:hypothetical protein
MALELRENCFGKSQVQKMNVAQLKMKYLEVFGEQARSGHKDFLRKKIAWRVQALAEGGLSERARRIALEIANDADLRMRAPKTTSAGGNGQPGPTVIAKVNENCRHHALLPGTYLVREFRGKTHTVKVLDQGFEYEDRRYRSLSGVAREITGVNWNGYTFFGLGGKQKTREAENDEQA